MNLGNTDLVIAVLPLLLFFGNELAMAELAFQDQVRLRPARIYG
jgi:hypothetical protein